MTTFASPPPGDGSRFPLTGRPGAALGAAQNVNPPLSVAALGFAPTADDEWCQSLGGHDIRFRWLRRLDELLPLETLQAEILGVTERDIVPASELVVVAETGGAVLGAFLPGEPEPTGALVGWGGFVAGRPRIVSDLLAVRRQHRNLGLGRALKQLQAAIALARGITEIVWTYEPLRAANARLNIERLGATAREYEVDRYGAGFGTGLYGGMPTDRLHVSWALETPRVRDRLLGRVPPARRDETTGLQRFDRATPADRALVPIPADIDAVIATDPAAALHWRQTVRESLQTAFANDFVITGFVPGDAANRTDAAYIIERVD